MLFGDGSQQVLLRSHMVRRLFSKGLEYGIEPVDGL